MWISEIRSSEGASAAWFKLLISCKLISRFSSALTAEFPVPLRLSTSEILPPGRPWAILFFRSYSESMPADGIEKASERSDSGAASKGATELFCELCWFWSKRICILFFESFITCYSRSMPDRCELFKLGEFSLFSLVSL